MCSGACRLELIIYKAATLEKIYISIAGMTTVLEQ